MAQAAGIPRHTILWGLREIKEGNVLPEERVRRLGEPLADYAIVVNIVAKTTMTPGLKVSCRSDRRRYLTGRKVFKGEWPKINLHRDDFHGD